ncbi:mucin-5B-like [Grus japonensis]|uniref:Mucin-5B-like n=1 Tax=Grus japonensis TaxID=30415 RepID=A0ABC9WX87_GRUJA
MSCGLSHSVYPAARIFANVSMSPFSLPELGECRSNHCVQAQSCWQLLVVLEVLAVMVAAEVGTVGVGGMMVVPSVGGGEVLEVLALLVVPMTVVPCVGGAVVLGTTVVPTVVLIFGSMTVEAVVGDVGGCVATVEVSAGGDVAADVVVLPAVVLEVLAVLLAEVGPVGVGGMMVVPSVGGGEVLEVLALLVVPMTVVPCVGGAVVLGTTVVPTVVLIFGSMTVEAVVGDVGGCVATVEVSAGGDVAADVVVLPAVVLEVLAVLLAEVGPVGVGGMMVVPSVGGGEVLEVLALLVVLMTVVPCVGGAVVLGTTVVPTVVLIFGSMTVEAVVGDVGGCVATVEVSAGGDVAADVVVLPAVVLEVLAVLLAEVGPVGVGGMMVVPSVGGGEVLEVLALLVVLMTVVPCVGGAVVLGTTVVPTVVLIFGSMTVEAVVGDVGGCVATVEVSAGGDVAADVVVLPAVVLEVLVLLAAEVGSGGVDVVMMVVDSVSWGEVLVVLAVLVVAIMVVPCVGGAVVLRTAVVPAVVVIGGCGRVEAVVGDVCVLVSTVEVSGREADVEDPAVLPGGADVVWQCLRSQHSTLIS